MNEIEELRKKVKELEERIARVEDIVDVNVLPFKKLGGVISPYDDEEAGQKND